MRVAVERSRVPMRVWLKVYGPEGEAVSVENVAKREAIRKRNQLLERLSEEHIEVTGEPIGLPTQGEGNGIPKRQR